MFYAFWQKGKIATLLILLCVNFSSCDTDSTNNETQERTIPPPILYDLEGGE